MNAICKLLKQLTLIVIVFNLVSCSGIPVGPNELLPMTQTQVVTGVYSVLSGEQPISFVFQHASGLRILLWPGATNGETTLWNLVCIRMCNPGWWRTVGDGMSMTGARASAFADYLQAGGWQRLTPVVASVAAKGQSVSQWMDLVANSLSGFFIVIPVIPAMIPEEGPQT
jgi:hypothetical protein